jgi:hypothetical protein
MLADDGLTQSSNDVASTLSNSKVVDLTGPGGDDFHLATGAQEAAPNQGDLESVAPWAQKPPPATYLHERRSRTYSLLLGNDAGLYRIFQNQKSIHDDALLN